MGELGVTGIRQYAGLVHDDFLTNWRTRQKYHIIEEMVYNEPLISGTYFAIRQLIKQVKWNVVPASDSAQDKAAADFVDECFENMNETREEFLDEALSFIPWGFAVHEIVYKRRPDGRIGWEKLPPRSQDSIWRWYFRENGEVTGLQQRAINQRQAVDIPIEKVLHFRNSPRKGNPEGQSIFRSSYIPYRYKKRIQEVEAIGIERDLNGLPVGRVPSNILNADDGTPEAAIRDAWKDMITNVRNDEQMGVLIPSDLGQGGQQLYDFELLSTEGSRSLIPGEVISRYNKEMLITTMADFMLLGHESVGSFALSNDKTHLFAVSVGGFMDEVSSVFNRQGIPRLLKLNPEFANLTEFPKLVHGDVETESLKEMADAMQSLALAGFNITDSEIQEELWRRVGFPQPEEPMVEANLDGSLMPGQQNEDTEESRSDS